MQMREYIQKPFRRLYVIKKTVAQIIVDILAEVGVKHCYGIVGDTLNQISSAIKKSNIEWVHVRHEEVGGLLQQG
nr:thiamine pyrophosphate-binding protein [Gilliamella sp. Pas-s25]